MQIKDVKTWAVANPPPFRGGPFWIFLKLTADNGIAGYGGAYGVPFAPGKVRELIEDIARRYVVGRSPFQMETIWRVMYAAGYSHHPEFTMADVMSAIEIALWDIVGKALDQPVYNLLGGKVSENLRKVAGNKADLLVKTHGEMTTSSAIRLAKRLEKSDPLWFEEPVPPENRHEMGLVAHATSIPVATGERLVSKYDFVDLLRHDGVAILQPALARVGGILEAKKIAGMTEAHYVQMASHLYAGPIEAAANIQLATCSPSFLIQESIETFGGFYGEVLKKPIEWQDSYIIPPTDPGIGYELDEEVCDADPFTGEGVYPPMAQVPVVPELEGR
ncbi:MAG: mandelate racemase/muconate lactonizing enzyme family protein [Sedimentisphaerales bacterium]|nr:mandelate racemase/muconate lactonizing enzyme family protein [Sedimentisphaerales bacterium]